MSARSRSKGIRGEREACEALAPLWPGLQRIYGQARANSSSPDIDAPGCPVFIEVKRQETISIHVAMKQAMEAAGRARKAAMGHPGTLGWEPLPVARPPLVIHKRNRGEWLITMRAADFVKLMLEAKGLDG